MIKGLVSVIVPVYKAEAYLHKCVDSILAQTYTNLEVILVNDGSPDNCGAICNKYAARDSRIKAVHKNNGGVSTARNAGIDVAQGEFVAFVDSDDYLEANMYALMYERISATGADICICGYKRISNNYSESIKVPHIQKISASQFFERFIEFKNNYRYTCLFVDPWNKLYRRSLLSKQPYGTDSPIRFQEWLRNSNDTYFNADCLSVCKKGGIVFVDALLYNHTITLNPDSLGKLGSLENYLIATERLRHTLLDILPNKANEIEKIINYRICAATAGKIHLAIIYGFPPPRKMTWSVVSTVLRYSPRAVAKISVVLMTILPRPVYRAVFRLYEKILASKSKEVGQ